MGIDKVLRIIFDLYLGVILLSTFSDTHTCDNTAKWQNLSKNFRNGNFVLLSSAKYVHITNKNISNEIISFLICIHILLMVLVEK